MSEIRVQRAHHLTMDELRARLEKVISKLNQQIPVESLWESEQLMTFKSSGASGQIEINEIQLVLTLKLGLMFRALKGPIEKAIVEAVDKQLARGE